jgi:hypothetical protein
MLLNILEEIAEFFRHTKDGYELTGSIIVAVVIALLLLLIGRANGKINVPPKPPIPTDRTRDIIKNGGRDERGRIITPYIKKGSPEKKEEKNSN